MFLIGVDDERDLEAMMESMKNHMPEEWWQKHSECLRSREYYPNLEVTQYLIPLGPYVPDRKKDDRKDDREEDYNNDLS